MRSDPEKIETLRWRDNKLEMIDQRILPAHFKYLAFDSAVSVAEAIRSMVVRGAPAIGCAAAYGFALEARRLEPESPENFARGLEQGFVMLAQSRPTAVNLLWALRKMREVWQDRKTESNAIIAAGLLAAAHEITAEDIRINHRLGEHGAGLLPDNSTVLTYCNAGALATAGHGTALGVIRSARDQGKRVSIIACETRPFLQGARLTAWEMVQEKIPVTLITDNMAGHFMSRGEIHAIVVGADRVAANGDVANKIGTYMLAVLAARHGIPFYVACPLSTIDLATASGDSIPIEERAAEEVTGYRDHQWAATGVTVCNPAFDVTPAGLVTALITEKGVVRAPTEGGIRGLFESSPAIQ